MLLLLSPAKTLDFETPLHASVLRRATEPDFADRAADLIGVLRRKSPAQVAALMGLSERLAALNVARYAEWQAAPDPGRARPALRAYAGDVYDGLEAATFAAADLDWAQRHLVILSGLYGALRPLDLIQPHRLEMGTALATRRGRDLYAWWGDDVAAWLNERQAGARDPVVVNLASVEYARAALRPALAARVVDCRFEDGRDGHWQVISFYAKRARGMLARHAIRRRARRVEQLHDFDGGGYALAPEASTPARLVFRREAQAALGRMAA